MDRKLRKFAALLAVLCLTLTGCNLIGVDPLMQIAEDRAAVSDVYETVLAEYDGGTVTVADIIYDFNYQWSYYYQLYAMAGMELDEETVAMLRDSCVDAAVERAAQSAEAERRGIALTEEELAEAEQTARQLYDESYASLLSQATDADEDVRAARTEYELYASGQGLRDHPRLLYRRGPQLQTARAGGRRDHRSGRGEHRAGLRPARRVRRGQLRGQPRQLRERHDQRHARHMDAGGLPHRQAHTRHPRRERADALSGSQERAGQHADRA